MLFLEEMTDDTCRAGRGRKRGQGRRGEYPMSNSSTFAKANLPASLKLRRTRRRRSRRGMQGRQRAERRARSRISNNQHSISKAQGRRNFVLCLCYLCCLGGQKKCLKHKGRKDSKGLCGRISLQNPCWRLRCPRRGVASFALAPLCGDLGGQKNVLNTKDAKIAKAFVAESVCRIHAGAFAVRAKAWRASRLPRFAGILVVKKMF